MAFLTAGALKQQFGYTYSCSTFPSPAKDLGLKDFSLFLYKYLQKQNEISFHTLSILVIQYHDRKHVFHIVPHRCWH